MIAAQYSALSALNGFATRVNANANNIANANSQGFKKDRVILAEAAPRGVKATVEKVDSPGTAVYEKTGNGSELVELSNVELARELPEMNLNARFYEANLKTLQTVDEMTAGLIDLKS